VDELRRGAQALGGGTLAARVAVRGDDELAELAREFNRMAALLEESVGARDRADASRRDLIAAVSHDLRTPLASLRAMNEALADGIVDDPATQARYLSTMRAQIDRLSGLIDDLFELSQIDAGALRLDLQLVAPSDLVSDLIEGLRPQAEVRAIALRGEVASGLAPAPMAAGKVERVIENLVTNGIRHTPAGGSVTISVAPAGDGAGLLFTVADTGEGIAAEDLPHIFERFYRGEKSRSRATGGAGLGLAIARGIVEAHGGRIWAESRHGEGTRVTFTLPLR
jgi:signal transduction histidine kinase